jgi:hypothetical protein
MGILLSDIGDYQTTKEKISRAYDIKVGAGFDSMEKQRIWLLELSACWQDQRYVLVIEFVNVCTFDVCDMMASG